MSNTDTGTTPTSKAKRERVTKRTWLKKDENGQVSETKDIREANGQRIEVIGGGTYESFTGDFAEPIQNGFMLFGQNIALTNTLGGLSGDEAFEALMARHETLAAGEWSDRKGAEGPRVSLLAQAVVAAFAAAGQTREVEAVKTMLLEKGADYRKALIGKDGNKAVKAEYDRLRAEAAAERARKSAEAANAAAQAEGATAPALPDL